MSGTCACVGLHCVCVAQGQRWPVIPESSAGGHAAPTVSGQQAPAAHPKDARPGEGERLTPSAAHEVTRQPPPGDALQPPPQRATAARLSHPDGSAEVPLGKALQDWLWTRSHPIPSSGPTEESSGETQSVPGSRVTCKRHWTRLVALVQLLIFRPITVPLLHMPRLA